MKCPEYDTDGEAPLLKSMENSFVAIIPWSTLNRSGSIYWGPIYG